MKVRWWGAAAVLLSGALGAASCRGLRGDEPAEKADVLYWNGTIVTMDDAGTTAECVATRGATIVCVGSGDTCCSQVHGQKTKVVDLKSATLLPGFIDSHSHMSGWALLNDPENWVDVSSVNVNLKPPPGDPRCKQADDYQQCFIPVKSQDEVVERLQRAAKTASNAPILGFNYDPARLGHAKGCKDGGVSFQCTNFEDGTAKAQLDKISATRRILIASESGHINYVNGKMLAALNICPPGAKGPGDGGSSCHMPIQNVAQEAKLARLGQLDEDLSFYATDTIITELLSQDGGSPLPGIKAAIRKGAATYARNGFTSVQEGAAAPGLAAVYAEVSLEESFPVTARMLLYDDTTTDLQSILKPAQDLRKLQNPSFKIAGLKAFADGSTQGYTGLLGAPYTQLWAPFKDRTIFPAQPYVGLPDVTKDGFAADFQAAHDAGFPMVVHQNGDAAIANVIAALPPPGGKAPRDMMIHFAMASPKDIEAVRSQGIGVTFLTPDLYYYGQPMCHQILGPQRTAQLYPAGDAVKAGVRFGLHADSPVTPPVPLFMIWTAKTRKTQQMSWYAKDPSCPEVMGEGQIISIYQGIRAFTIDAAWLYGEDSTIGSIEVGKTADMVQLSHNPLSMEDEPDALKTIRVLGTMHRGKFIPNPDAALQPIWPE